eukprot:RCo027305
MDAAADPSAAVPSSPPAMTDSSKAPATGSGAQAAGLEPSPVVAGPSPAPSFKDSALPIPPAGPSWTASGDPSYRFPAHSPTSPSVEPAADSSSSDATGSGLQAAVGEEPVFMVQVEGRAIEDNPDYTQLLTLQRTLRRASANTDWDALSEQIKAAIRDLNLVTEEMPDEVIAGSPRAKQANLKANAADA